MPTPIQVLSQKILNARTVEEIFGVLDHADEESLNKVVRKLQLQVHPDHNTELNANEVFDALTKLAAKAFIAIIGGTYGANKKINTTTIISKKDEYEVGERSYTGENSIIYRGTNKGNNPIVIRLAKTPANNKAIKDSAAILTKMKDVGTAPVVPDLIDTFNMIVNGKKQEALVFNDPPCGDLPSLTLTKIMQHYPNGVAPEHFVWMMKRMLSAILHAEKAKVLHGAILPCHIVVYHDSHLEKLIGWSHAVEYGKPRKPSIEKFKDYYPDDYAVAKSNSTTDIYMLAKCMIKILGGNIITNDLPPQIPLAIGGFLKSLVVGHSELHASSVFKSVTELASQIFGKPKFITLNIPT